MTQKDAEHSGFVHLGPKTPLKGGWRASTDQDEGNFTTWPVHRAGTVFARSGPGILAVRASSGERRWFHEPTQGVEIVAPALDERRVIVPVGNGVIIALDQETGTEAWTFTASGRITLSPTVAGGKVFFGASEAKKFYALDADTGRLIWEQSFPGEPASIPAVGNGLVIFNLLDLETGAEPLVALDLETGVRRWAVGHRDANSSPSIMEDRVITGGGDFFAHALDIHTGKEIWRSPVIGKFGYQNSPAIAYGDVFLADRLGHVYRIDGETGKRKWIWRRGVGTFMQSFPVVAGKTLYIGSGGGWLYAIDVDSGKLLWKHQVGGFILSGAADEKHFYFGVKFRNEGLYAYEHDPTGGKGAAGPSQGSGNGAEGVPVGSLLAGLVVVVALIAGGTFVLKRRSNR
ncbi:MAG: PQQ-binding-like beta-propeller repeat protein [Actinomycetota bacterium]